MRWQTARTCSSVACDCMTTSISDSPELRAKLKSTACRAQPQIARKAG
jgi:hypothetical protein